MFVFYIYKNNTGSWDCAAGPFSIYLLFNYSSDQMHVPTTRCVPFPYSTQLTVQRSAAPECSVCVGRQALMDCVNLH